MFVWTPYVLSLLIGCSDEEVVVDETPQDVAAVAVPAEKSNTDILREIKVAIGIGDSAKAFELLKETSMNEDEINQMTAYIAGGAGWAKGDISAFTKRSDWANLISGNAQKAYDVSTDSGIKALALVRGATSALIPEREAASQKGAEPRFWNSEESLELLIATKEIEFLESAKAVTTWSGQLALAEWAAQEGQPEISLAAYEAASSLEGFGQLYASVQLASHTSDASKLVEHLRKASAVGDVVAGWTALSALIDIHQANGTLSALWEQTYEALKAEHKIKLSKASWETLAIIRVGVLTGHSGEVLGQVNKLLDQTQFNVLQEAVFYGAIIGSQMNDSELMAATVEKASTEKGGLIAAIATNGSDINLDNISIEKQVLIANAIAPQSGEFSSDVLPKILAADLGPLQRVSLSLVHDDWIRFSGGDNSSALDALAQQFPSLNNLQHEIAIRKSLYSKVSKFSVDASDEDSVALKAWAGVATSTKPVLETKERSVIATIKWAEVKDTLKNKKPLDPLMDDLWQNSPLHRVGILSTNTVLDFSRGANFTGTFRALIGQNNDAMASASVGLLEMARTAEEFQRTSFNGQAALAGLPKDKVQSLLGATQAFRAGVSEFWMGGAYPVEESKALDSAEMVVLDLPVDSKLYPSTVIAGNSVREQFKTITSVISIFPSHGEYLAGVISPSVSGAVSLGSAATIDRLYGKHFAELESGVTKDKINHYPGNDLRETMLSPLAELLSGVAKYMIVVPEPLSHFALSTLPEQKDGLRYMADKRKITLATSLDATWSANQVYADYELDMLAFGRSTQTDIWMPSVTDANSSSLLATQDFSPEIGMAKVHFSEASKVLMREEATVKAFVKHAPKARYLYLSEIPATPDGGFQMADGEVSLEDISGLALEAMIVFLSPAKNPAHQAARVEAFMQAGVQAVIVQSWAIPSNDLRVLLENFFVALKRNDPMMEAMSKSRSKYIQDKSKDKYTNNASIWGAFTVFGRP